MHWAYVKRLFLGSLLFFISFFLLAPTIIIPKLVTTREEIEEAIGKGSKVSTFLSQYFAPLITLMINFGLIPLLVDLFIEFEDYRRKSSKQISIMRKI